MPDDDPTHGRRRQSSLAVLGAALHPLTGPRLAHLRHAELQLTSAHPRPTVVAVLAMAPALGASALTALLAQTLHGVAPSRVAVVDCDGTAQPQRRLLGAQGGGDLRAMLASRSAWRIRRAVERYACPGAVVPLYCVAAGTPGALSAADMLTAVRLIRRRHPVVVLDVPVAPDDELAVHAVRAADCVVAVVAAGTSGAAVRAWVGAVHPDVGLTVACPQGPDAAAEVDLALPLHTVDQRAPVRVAAAPLALLAGVEDLAVRVTARWRDTVLPTVTEHNGR